MAGKEESWDSIQKHSFVGWWWASGCMEPFIECCLLGLCTSVYWGQLHLWSLPCLSHVFMSVYLNVWPTSLTSVPRGFFAYTICFLSSLSCFRKRHQHPRNSSDQKLGRYLHVLSGPQTPPSSPANPCVSTPKKHLGSDCSSAGSHFFFFSFWCHHRARGVLVPQPGMEPVSPQWNHRGLTTKKTLCFPCRSVDSPVGLRVQSPVQCGQKEKEKNGIWQESISSCPFLWWQWYSWSWSLCFHSSPAAPLQNIQWFKWNCSLFPPWFQISGDFSPSEWRSEWWLAGPTHGRLHGVQTVSHSHAQKGLWLVWSSTVTVLEFLVISEPETLHFHFVLGTMNYW